jgi:hypothetical protein
MESGPTGPIEESGPTGETGPTGPAWNTDPLLISEMSGGTAEPPRILLSDLMSQASVLQQQESTDTASLTALATPDVSDIRNKMTAWLASGMQGACNLVRVPITPPNVCSDGVSRNIYDYIVFLSGKSILEHMKAFQDLLPEFEVGYRCSRTEIVFCVIRVMV